MTCEICKRVKRTKNAATLKRDRDDFFGLIEYFTPVWERWHLCRDCLRDVCQMLLAVRDTTRGTDPAITVEDFTRHAVALNTRMRDYERRCAGTDARVGANAHTHEGEESGGVE